MPKRIQMSRQRPWRAENPDAVIVARPSKWGNPFQVGLPTPIWERRRWPARHTPETAVQAFRERITEAPEMWAHVAQAQLAGRDLACWCPLDQPCHADVLLELANGRAR